MRSNKGYKGDSMHCRYQLYLGIYHVLVPGTVVVRLPFNGFDVSTAPRNGVKRITRGVVPCTVPDTVQLFTNGKNNCLINRGVSTE